MKISNIIIKNLNRGDLITENQNNSMFIRVVSLVVGLLIDTLGNGLTIVADCGSAVWTAAAVNLSNWLPISSSMFIFIFGILFAIMNQLLLWKLDIIRFINECIFMIFFSYFIDEFSKVFIWMGLNKQNYLISAFLSVLGVICIGVAISLYQRSNLFMHPDDDMTNILRFKFLKGSAPMSQLINVIPAILIIIISGLIVGHFDAINIGTVFYVIFNGFVIKYADHLMVPKLIHNFKDGNIS